jgi:hypothetical protein
MTGAYLLAVRDGKRQPVEVEHLTDAERESKLANDPNLMAWVHMLCHRLVKVETLFQQLEREDIIGRK